MFACELRLHKELNPRTPLTLFLPPQLTPAGTGVLKIDKGILKNNNGILNKNEEGRPKNKYGSRYLFIASFTCL